MSKAHYIFILVIVLAIALFTRWLLSSVEEPLIGIPPEARHDPDYFLTEFRATVLDKKGLPIYRLAGDRIDQAGRVPISLIG